MQQSFITKRDNYSGWPIVGYRFDSDEHVRIWHDTRHGFAEQVCGKNKL